MFLKIFYGFTCDCFACRKRLPTENPDMEVVLKCYENLGKLDNSVEFKALIEKFIKPCFNYYTKKILIEQLYYFHLGQIDFNRFFQKVFENYVPIEQGLF